MRPSFIQAALALSSIATTFAFNELSFPSTAVADTDVQLQITNDLSSSSSFDKQFDSFRVYLSTTPPGWGSGVACYLVNSSAIATTEVSFKIPASVGPDGSSYSIATEEFNQNSDAAGPSGFEYSSDFDLTNATGSWSAYELAGQVVGDADNVPCTAYDCARNCSQTFYPANVNTTSAYKSTYECIAACPGVTYESYGDASGGGGSSPTGSVTEVDTTSTASGTASSSTSQTTTLTGPTTTSTTGTSGTASTSTTSTSSATTPSHSTSAAYQNSGPGLTLLSTVHLLYLAFEYIAPVLSK